MKINKLGFNLNTIGIITIIIFLLISYVILYNISFKYDKKDIFFQGLMLRSTQLDDVYVAKNLNSGLNTIFNAINDPEIGEATFKHIYETKNLTTQYVGDNIINHFYSADLYKHGKFLTKVSKKLGLIKQCTNDECFAKKYTDLYNRTFDEFRDKSFYQFKTPDGTPYAIIIDNPTCSKKMGLYSQNCGYGYIDINGKKGPNQLGIDLYDFGIWKKGSLLLVRMYLSGDIAQGNCLYGQGLGCTEFALNGVRPYLVYSVAVNKSKYKFKTREFDYVYLTPKGKLIYFNSGGFMDFVTPKSIGRNFQSLKNYIYLTIIKPPISKMTNTSRQIITKTYHSVTNHNK